MGWYVTWQDAIALVLAVTGVAAAFLLHRRQASASACRACATRADHAHVDARTGPVR
jgi:hypothetical protein